MWPPSKDKELQAARRVALPAFAFGLGAVSATAGPKRAKNKGPSVGSWKSKTGRNLEKAKKKKGWGGGEPPGVATGLSDYRFRDKGGLSVTAAP